MLTPSQVKLLEELGFEHTTDPGGFKIYSKWYADKYINICSRLSDGSPYPTCFRFRGELEPRGADYIKYNPTDKKIVSDLAKLKEGGIQ